ncbi:hypothetical protein A6A04_20495 [Paramagnetospirillum marisnigri]|uniref:Uncharacterized protein n=1 Tax=Paramagnetospirillum marisnigri TaxID=1285242 RepID=A0A178MEL5_9PROT|nr:FliG C-terminal domain-containing protein [Paramagnetospirillum marisnigri]OAN46966.1 hypothetical protein A6A04_20495 [Paramagnetospirillum marisnigri]
MDDIDKTNATIPLTAGSLEDAMAVWDRGDYETAVRLLRPRAVRGDVHAQFTLGFAYEHGDGVPQVADAAMRWYRMAADQGMAAAQHHVGLLYETGNGVTRDYAEALRWFHLAADQDDAYAQCQIGVLYSCGLAVEQDYAEAMRWFRMAADKGNTEAQFRIGALYASGHGVEQDYCEAIRWYRLAADQGFWAAQLNIASMYVEGQGVAQDFTEAKRWYDLADGGGSVAGVDILASTTPAFDHDEDMVKAWEDMLSDAPVGGAAPVDDDVVSAPISELEQVAREGDSKAALALGLALLQSPEQNERAKGTWWIERAAELGLTEAQTRLADLLATKSSLAASRLYGIARNEEVAAWWRAVATATPLRRKQIERGWSVVGPAVAADLAVVPVADLKFEDIPGIGSEAMLSLLRQTAPKDWVWALSLHGCDGSARLRHFVLSHLPEQAARTMMRDILALNDEREPGGYPYADDRIVGRLRNLIDDGEVVLPAALAEDLQTRERELADALGNPLYDFSCRRKEFEAAYGRLARRPSRGAPMSPLDHLVTSRTRSGPLGQQGVHGNDPAPGWYADTLGVQPNTTIRVACSAVGENHLFDFLAGSPPFTRFRLWQVFPFGVRHRFASASLERVVAVEMHAEGKAAMDDALKGLHRAGTIAWWSEAGEPSWIFDGAPLLINAVDLPVVEDTSAPAEPRISDDEEALMAEWAAMAGETPESRAHGAPDDDAFDACLADIRAACDAMKPYEGQAAKEASSSTTAEIIPIAHERLCREVAMKGAICEADLYVKIPRNSRETEDDPA